MAHASPREVSWTRLVFDDDSDAPVAGLETPPPSSVDPLWPGDLIGEKYRVIERIGAGGTSLVYLALDEDLKRQVAVKLLRPEHAHRDEIRRRFLAEARILARLSGANVARVLDFGRFVERGSGTVQPYMVIEYLEGCDLAELLDRRGRLEASETVALALAVCAGLEEAHAIGVVHRDIKPENLFLAVDRREHTTFKILDFGVSKHGAPDVGSAHSGFAVGSPHYVAPEQLRSPTDVDGRADIWSLGVVMFEALTGRLPFESESFMELCAQVLSQPAPDLRRLRPDLDLALVRVIERCLEKDRARRFGGVRELAVALEAAAPARGRRGCSG